MWFIVNFRHETRLRVMETSGYKSDTGWPRASHDDNTRGDTWRNWKGCQLDADQCLSLEQILQSFSAPISEEHAWAVIHQVSQKNYFFKNSLFYWKFEFTTVRSPIMQCTATAVFQLLNKFDDISRQIFYWQQLRQSYFTQFFLLELKLQQYRPVRKSKSEFLP